MPGGDGWQGGAVRTERGRGAGRRRRGVRTRLAVCSPVKEALRRRRALPPQCETHSPRPRSPRGTLRQQRHESGRGARSGGDGVAASRRWRFFRVRSAITEARDARSTFAVWSVVVGRWSIALLAMAGWLAGWSVAQGQDHRTQRTASGVMPGTVAAMRGATGYAERATLSRRDRQSHRPSAAGWPGRP